MIIIHLIMRNTHLILIFKIILIKGSWDKIGMFDGMLSMSVHVTLLSSDDLLIRWYFQWFDCCTMA